MVFRNISSDSKFWFDIPSIQNITIQMESVGFNALKGDINLEIYTIDTPLRRETSRLVLILAADRGG
jgi:hypothetical protein